MTNLGWTVVAGSSELLTFGEFSQINARRCERWHPGWRETDDSWSIADWSNAMCGEAGEAANVVKKMRRVESGVKGTRDPTYEQLRNKLAEEIADAFTYLDLLATKCGIDLPRAVADKFNLVSAREEFPERIIFHEPGVEVGGDEFV